MVREKARGVVDINHRGATEYVVSFCIWKEGDGLVQEGVTIGGSCVTPVLVARNGRIRVYCNISAADFDSCYSVRLTLVVDVVNSIGIAEQAIGIVLSIINTRNITLPGCYVCLP